MKNTIKIIMIMAIAVIALNANGQTGQTATAQPDLSNILNLPEFAMVYQLKSAYRVYVSVNGQLPSNNDRSYGSVLVADNSADGIFAAIMGRTWPVDVANPNDPIWIWIGVYDANDNLLFDSDKEISLVTAKGGYDLPKDYGDMVLALVGPIHIAALDGSLAAFVDILDANGTTQSEDWLTITNGQVSIPLKYIGQNVILGVLTAAGQWQYWNIGAEGSIVQMESFDLALKVRIENLITVADGNVYEEIATDGGVGKNIVVELKSTSQQWIAVSLATTEGKQFIGFWAWGPNDSGWTKHMLPVGANYSPYLAQAGVTHFVGIFANGAINPLPTKG